jgi:hypothetical protein
MATVQGTLAQSLEDASAAVRRAAEAHGYTWVEGQSGPYTLVFKKGGSGFSLGSQATVQLRASSPAETELTLSVEENLPITDWGRSRRAAHRLLDAVGARR